VEGVVELPEPVDIVFRIGPVAQVPPQPSPLGAGYLILVEPLDSRAARFSS